MKQSAIFLSLFAFVICVTSTALAGERTVYREDFDRLGDYVASFNKGARIAEWPASLKMLEFNPDGLQEARKGFFNIETPPQSGTYAVFFRFMLNNPTNRTIRLRLFFGDRAKPDVRDLVVDERRSWFVADANAAYKLDAPRLDGFPGPRKWIKAPCLSMTDTPPFMSFEMAFS